MASEEKLPRSGNYIMHLLTENKLI